MLPRWLHLILCATFLVGPGWSQNTADQENQTTEAQEALDAAVQELEGEGREEPATPQEALDAAVQDLPPQEPSAAAASISVYPSRSYGGSGLQNLIDISLDVLVAAGWSSEPNSSIELLEGGGHDPKRRGFTLQQAEVGLAGAVDPYFSGEAYIVFFEGGVELEEAFLLTSSLPSGLQAKVGLFLSEFGRNNQRHPHQWYFIDQPFINTRLFGGDGSRAPGARLSWLLPASWPSELYFSVQNATSEQMASFLGAPPGGHSHTDDGHSHRRAPVREEDEHEHDEEEYEAGIGGRPQVYTDVNSLSDLVYLLRWENGFDVSSTWSTQIGISGMVGPNTTGPAGSTALYGTDIIAKWRPETNFRGWPFFVFQGEIMGRRYKAQEFGGPGDEHYIPADTLKDWGLYAQALYGFKYRWTTGLRYEYGSGSGESLIEGGRAADPFRDDRHRLSALLTFHPSEYSRLRVQYNYDRADHLDDDAHSIWFGLEWLYGAHPAHRY